MFRMRHFPVLILLALLSWPAVAFSQAVCFKCHDKKNFTDKVVHKPVAQGNCTNCHNPHVARFDKLLTAKTADLCYGCHNRQKKDFQQGIVHAPIHRGECLMCHQPHAAGVKGLLVGKTRAGVCFTCHKNLQPKYKVTHRPYAKGQCAACHDPHNSKNNHLLRKSVTNLCAGCHTAKKIEAGHRNFPIQPKECLSCHNPHGSERRGLVRNVLHKPYTQSCTLCHAKGKLGEENCLTCHENVRTALQSAHNHMIGGAANSCTNCHSPHTGDGPGLFKGAERSACRGCHEATIIGSDRSLHRHPDLITCSNCHAAHGSNELAMMKADHNAVCTQCHETQGKFTHPVGAEVFDPRTGQPVTCVSCHDAMGTDYKFHLKASGSKELCIHCHRSY